MVFQNISNGIKPIAESDNYTIIEPKPINISNLESLLIILHEK